jgi:3,4-dihydroxy-2-butanone 4-phosphate synthase
MMIYCFDLDGTLCTQDGTGAYDKVTPLSAMIARVNELYDAGHTIMINTARGCRSGIDWTEATTLQLETWGVKYHELIVGKKPHYDVVVDDKAHNPISFRNQLIGDVERAVEDIRAGRPIIIVDDYSRENEGDLVLAAATADKNNLTFMLRHAGGLMCVPCTADRLQKLQIPMMPTNGLDTFGTPFALSIDAVEGTTTGMSISDRLKTLSVFMDDTSLPSQLAYPGHLFPLRAHPELLRGRRGHTESSVEIVKQSGHPEVAIIVEIMNDDGSMKKGQDLINFAGEYNLTLISVQDLYDYIYEE